MEEQGLLPSQRESTASTERSSAVFSESVRLLYNNLPLTVGANILLSALVGWIMLGTTPTWEVWAWFGGIVAVSIVRLYAWYLFSRDHSIQSLIAWRRWYMLAIFVMGLLWAYCIWLAQLSSNELNIYLITFVIAGITSGIVASTAGDKIAVLTFNTPVLGALALYFIYEGHYEYSTLLLVHFLFVANLSKNIGFMIEQQIITKHKNIELAEQAVAEKNRAEIVGANLESQNKALQEMQRALRLKHGEVEALAQENMQSREAAEQASIAKSNFLASMSHELRTPMSGVLGMLSLLMSTDLDDKQHKYTAAATSSGERLLQLLNDILDLSKIEAGKIELDIVEISLRNILIDTEILWRPIAEEKGLDLNVTISDELPDAFLGDPLRVRQVLANLVSNAIKFSSQGGVTILLSGVEAENMEWLITFQVTDTGVGIAPEVQDELFHKFVQADASISRKFGGTGLGLVICKQLVELMGGEIMLDSQSGQGTTFCFSLKLHKLTDRNALCNALGVVEFGGDFDLVLSREVRILLAEDNEINRLIVLSLLEYDKLLIDEAENGIKAVEMIKKQHYDLVLMDIQMPEMDGMEATRVIRNMPTGQTDIPIIALTANAMAGDKEKYLVGGMQDYISKPIQKKAFFDALTRQCDAIKIC
tara:strand:- start:5215 stop:7161 length:1947 start_codon:yes stop_codon:yes gene_type:complete